MGVKHSPVTAYSPKVGYLLTGETDLGVNKGYQIYSMVILKLR